MIVSSDSGVEKVCYIKNVPSEIVKLSVKLSTSVGISLNFRLFELHRIALTSKTRTVAKTDVGLWCHNDLGITKRIYANLVALEKPFKVNDSLRRCFKISRDCVRSRDIASFVKLALNISTSRTFLKI